MGQTISAIKTFVQDDTDKEKLANDALNSLMQVANSRMEQFYTEIRSPQFDTALIPIDKIIDRQQSIYCGVSDKSDTISEELHNSFSDFASGDVVKGITSVLSGALQALLGNVSANSSSVTKYVICTGDLGGIMRLDVNLYYYQYTYSQLTTITKDVMAASIVLSSVDTSTLKDNTLRVIVQKTYKDADKDTQKSIYNQLKAVMDGSDTSDTAAATDTSNSSSIKQSSAPSMPLSHQRSKQRGPTSLLRAAQVSTLPLHLDETILRSRFRRAVAMSNGTLYKTIDAAETDIVQRLAQFQVYVIIGRNTELIPKVRSYMEAWLWKTFDVAEDVEVVASVETEADSKIEYAVGVVVTKKQQSKCTQKQLEDACESALSNLESNPGRPEEFEGYNVLSSS